MMLRHMLTAICCAWHVVSTSLNVQTGGHLLLESIAQEQQIDEALLLNSVCMLTDEAASLLARSVLQLLGGIRSCEDAVQLLKVKQCSPYE